MSTLTDMAVTTTTGKRVPVSSLTEAAKVANLSEIQDIDTQIAILKARRDIKVEALYDLFGAKTGKHIVPGVGSVTFSDNNVYDDKTIMAALRPGQQRLVTKRVLDRAKVRAMYPAVYEAARSYRGFKASVTFDA